MVQKTHGRIPIRRHRLPLIETYEVTEDELDRIEHESMQIGESFQFATVCLTAALTCLTTLLSVPIESEWKRNSFLSVTIVGFVLALYFGIRWLKERKRTASVIQRIRDREVGPLGDEEKEIRPAELAELSSELEETDNKE